MLGSKIIPVEELGEAALLHLGLTAHIPSFLISRRTPRAKERGKRKSLRCAQPATE
jgi:hypothetical protein